MLKNHGGKYSNWLSVCTDAMPTRYTSVHGKAAAAAAMADSHLQTCTYSTARRQEGIRRRQSSINSVRVGRMRKQMQQQQQQQQFLTCKRKEEVVDIRLRPQCAECLLFITEHNLVGVNAAVSAFALSRRRNSNTHDGPYGQSCENITSSTKPEVHNVSQRR